MKRPLSARALASALLAALSLPAFAIDSALTYQGHLTDAGQPATGSYDLQFTLQDTGSATVGAPILVDNASVVGGVFTVELDFGPSAFSGADRFLQIGVRRGNEAGAFTPLAPRSPITPAPYAQTSAAAEFAVTVANDSIGSAQILAASVSSADIDASMQRRVNGACASGTAIATISANGSVTCESGLQGATGPAGAIGPQGATGPQGVSGSTDAWSRLGNAGTNPATNFIGTLDAQAFEVRANNARVQCLESVSLLTGNTANLLGGSASNQILSGVRGAVIAGGGAPNGGPQSGGGSDPELNVAPNKVFDHYASVLGGFANEAGSNDGDPRSAFGATIGGGSFNRASNTNAVAAGGVFNVASGSNSSVGGGSMNTASRAGSAIAGGSSNLASGAGAFVGGGTANGATGISSAVGGGEFNFASASNSTVSGGSDNCAGGASSWAGGQRAKVRPGIDPNDFEACDGLPNYSGDSNGDEGSFVWADSQAADFVSTGPNQFNVRARGGVTIIANGAGNGVDIDAGAEGVQIAGYGGMRFDSNSNVYFNTPTGGRQMLNLYDTTYGIGMQTSVMYFRSATAFAWFEDGTHADGSYDPGGGTLQMKLDSGANLTVTGVVNAAGFNPPSDRNIKTAFESVDTADVLARVLELPLTQWSYKASIDQRHIGPMAQDFHAAFGLNGDDDKHINTIDADGVALAAIQGLNAKLEVENAAQDAELASLREEIAALRALLSRRER